MNGATLSNMAIMDKNEKETQEGKEIRQEGTDWTDLLTRIFDFIMSRLRHKKEKHEYTLLNDS